MEPNSPLRIAKPPVHPHSHGMKVLAGILVAVIAALVWSVFTLNETRRQMTAQQQSNEIVIADFSNRWETTRRNLDEQKAVNVTLETNLTDRAHQLDKLRVEIAALNTDLARSRAETKTAQEEILKRDSQITSLESKNVDLTKQMGDLQNSIAGLEKQINETERKLAASEGNRAELLRNLKRLQDEKATLEKQLTDLEFVRDQVRKLREELTVARRLDWIRRGIFQSSSRKGGEALAEMKFRDEPSPAPGAPALNVELKRSGEVTITPVTNPPAKPSP